jgi:threonine aldolase
MRQAGIIAAGGLFALKNHLDRIEEDHRKAKELAQGLSQIDGVILMNEIPPTNMVYVRFIDQVSLRPKEIVKKLMEQEILVGRESEHQFRLVTHLGISDEDIKRVVEAFKQVMTT